MYLFIDITFGWRKLFPPLMNQGWRQSLGEQISAARRGARVSQETLAKYAGITRPHLSAYERGRVRTPKAEVLARISERLNSKLSIDGISLGPEQLAPPGKKLEERPAVQLKLPFDVAGDAMKILRALQRGATVTVEKRQNRLLIRTTLPIGSSRSAQKGD